MDQRTRTGALATKSVSLFIGLCLTFSVGCERAEPLHWQVSAATKALTPDLSEKVTTAVREHSGTALKPRLVTVKAPTFDEEQHLKNGQRVYLKRCVQCHGVSGDGNGPVAGSLYPRPRDYTRGIFKFTSTAYGSKPRRDDLVATLKRGITGTSMPAFNLISHKDLESVADYVIVLAQRGELEYQLTAEAADMEELDPESVPDLVDDVRTRWNDAKAGLTQPLSPQPELTEERVKLGREAFVAKRCVGCHGEDGRGHTKENIGRDSWGHATRAADLTSGMLHGGHDPVDIYRRILNGINGTPMPGFRSSLESEPDTIWNLVAYVLHVSGSRSRGESIPAGLMKPYGEPPADPVSSEPDAAPAEEPAK